MLPRYERTAYAEAACLANCGHRALLSRALPNSDRSEIASRSNALCGRARVQCRMIDAGRVSAASAWA